MSGPLQRFAVSFPDTVTAGETNNMRVVAKDASGAVDNGYFGTVDLPRVTLLGGGRLVGVPTDYTFTFEDQGVTNFSGVRFTAESTWVLSVVDRTTHIGKSIQVGVDPAPGAQSVDVGSGPAATVGVLPISGCGGTAAACVYVSDMMAHFPLLGYSGIGNICSCRDIATLPGVWSQHSWCNAVDLFASLEYGNQAYAYAQANASRLSIAHLLWQVENHYDHIHADFYPQGEGTPPCAGG